GKISSPGLAQLCRALPRPHHALSEEILMSEFSGSTENSEQFDVVVVGGGPGGSSLAALVAKRGHRVLVLESEKFPRYQIGESLLPSTVHGICRLTGAADDLARASFTRKGGGTFKWGANP